MGLVIAEVSAEEIVVAGVCGLCGNTTELDEEGVAYIVCAPCYCKFLNVSAAYKKQLDELPFGVIDLNAQATIMAYNKTEAELAQLQADEVMGRNFFTEVAPCAAVKEFQGRFHEFRESDELLMRFNFTFSFKHGPVAVEIYFLRWTQAPAPNLTERLTRVIVKRLTK